MLDELLLVQTTLHQEWGPIGIVELNGPEDEYHAYANQVYRQLLQRWEPARTTCIKSPPNTSARKRRPTPNKLSAASKEYI